MVTSVTAAEPGFHSARRDGRTLPGLCRRARVSCCGQKRSCCARNEDTGKGGQCLVTGAGERRAGEGGAGRGVCHGLLSPAHFRVLENDISFKPLSCLFGVLLWDPEVCLLSILLSASSPTLSYYISPRLKTEHSLCF